MFGGNNQFSWEEKMMMHRVGTQKKFRKVVNFCTGYGNLIAFLNKKFPSKMNISSNPEETRKRHDKAKELEKKEYLKCLSFLQSDYPPHPKEYYDPYPAWTHDEEPYLNGPSFLIEETEEKVWKRIKGLNDNKSDEAINLCKRVGDFMAMMNGKYPLNGTIPWNPDKHEKIMQKERNSREKVLKCV